MKIKCYLGVIAIVVSVVMLNNYLLFGTPFKFSYWKSIPSQLTDSFSMRDEIYRSFKENPDLLTDIIKGLQEEKIRKDELVIRNKIEKNYDLIFTDSDPRIGDKNSNIKIAEFVDYNCMYCKRMLGLIDKIHKENPSVKIFFKPMAKLGNSSYLMAKASVIAYIIAPDKYYSFHKTLMRDGPITNTTAIIDTAARAGINIETFKKKWNDEETNAFADDVLKQNHRAMIAMDFKTVPAYIVGKKAIPHSTNYQTFNDLLQSEKHLEKNSQGNSYENHR